MTLDPTTPFLDLEAMAQTLEASGAYRVLRRLAPGRRFASSNGAPTRLAVYLDVETTGLDPQRDEIIQLAMAPFTYGVDGRIYEVGEPFNQLRQPAAPIPAEITQITGIDDAMVAGRSIDPADVAHFVGPAALVIAHNAAFDRRFLERFCETFTTKAWACSMSQVDWGAAGHDGVKLTYLCNGAGFFYDAHNALNDCQAGIELLARPSRAGGANPFAELLERARKPTWRIWAEHSPYELKDQLKARGYRWNGEGNPSPRAWYVDVEDHAKDAELTYLAKQVYQREVNLLVKRVDAYDRFSDRA